jgi:hypothetical protein
MRLTMSSHISLNTHPKGVALDSRNFKFSNFDKVHLERALPPATYWISSAVMYSGTLENEQNSGRALGRISFEVKVYRTCAQGRVLNVNLV